MKQLIVIFEFQPANNSKIRPFYDMIRQYGKFAFITNKSCIIWTEATAIAVRDFLKTGLGSGDKLFVADISAPAAWTSTVSKEVSEYIIKNLKDISRLPSQ